jgi:hypothetical protein
MKVWPAAAAAVLGIAVGASLTQLRDHHYAATLAESLRVCRVEHARQQVEAARLRDQLQAITQTPVAPVVARVQVELVGSGPPLADVEAALEPLTSSLLGVAVSRLDPELVWQAFNGRQITILAHRYRVDARVVLIAPTTRVLVKLVPDGP